jgi:hypothetical protein
VTVNTTVKLDRPVAGSPTGNGAAVHTQVEPVARAVKLAALQVNDVLRQADASDGLLRPNSKRDEDLKKIQNCNRSAINIHERIIL